MTLSDIVLEFKKLSQLPRMDSTLKRINGGESLSLQERILALRQKNRSPAVTPKVDVPSLTKEPEVNQQVSRGRETGQGKSEPLRGRKVKRKISPVAEARKTVVNSVTVPARRPKISPRKKAVTSTAMGLKAETSSVKGFPQLSPSQKVNNPPLKNPPKLSPKRKSDSSILRSPRERKTKTPISDRISRFREKLSADASKKTGARRALNVTVGPSTPETQTSNKKPFKIPKIIPKPRERLNKSPPVEDSTTASNYTEMAMDIDSSVCSSPVEDMDWEINEVRRELRDPLFTRDCETSTSTEPSKTLTVDGQWITAIDTNVFISDLSFVQELRDTQVTGLGFPVIYVPHRVLSELDALKDRPQVKSESVARSARKAVTYLNSCLVEKHPRVKGQSISDYIAMKDLVDMSADDKILLSCLQLKKIHPDKLLVFISNDTNLRNKAIIEDIETFSVENFKKFFLSDQNEIDPAKMDKTRLESRLKNTIKVVLTEILETELKTKFRTINNLDDALDFFIQKWGCHFASSLPVPAEEQLQKMRTTLQFEEKAMPSPLVTLLDAAASFITHFYVKGKRYFNSVEKALKVLSNLRPLALDFDNGSPEEKHVTGALEAVLRLAWETMYLESDSINKAKVAHDPNYELRERHFLQSLSHLIEVFSKVMATSLFDIPSSAAVSDLASILASCTEDDSERVTNLLVHVCTTIDGRNMIANAFKIFQAAYNNCSAESQS